MPRNVDTQGYFGTNYGAVSGSVKMNAWMFGLIVDDRRWKQVTGFGLPGHHIPFQYFGEPDGVPVLPKEANYDQTEIIGRFENLINYKGSNNIPIDLSLVYYAEGSESTLYNGGRGHNTKWTTEAIHRITAKLEGMVYPDYDNSFRPPPRVLLNILGVIQELPCSIRSCSIKGMAPFDIVTGQARRFQVNLSMITNYPAWQAVGSRDFLRYATQTRENNRGKTDILAYRKFSRSRTR